jgi:hypothetical protein
MSYDPTPGSRLDCAERCQVPAGVTLKDMPPSRHAWSDIVRCPNDGCGREFLVVPTPGEVAEEDRRAELAEDEARERWAERDD